jgi:WXG100 family type VII secretion target
MTVLRQDIDTIRSLSSRVANERSTTVETLLATLRSINSELDAAWDGPAQVTFNATYGDWILKLENFANTLNSVHAYLKSVADNFEMLEQEAKRAAESAAASAAGNIPSNVQ